VIRAGGVASAGPTAPPNPGGKQRVHLAHGDRGPFTEAKRAHVHATCWLAASKSAAAASRSSVRARKAGRRLPGGQGRCSSPHWTPPRNRIRQQHGALTDLDQLNRHTNFHPRRSVRASEAPPRSCRRSFTWGHKNIPETLTGTGISAIHLSAQASDHPIWRGANDHIRHPSADQSGESGAPAVPDPGHVPSQGAASGAAALIVPQGGPESEQWPQREPVASVQNESDPSASSSRRLVTERDRRVRGLCL
jgi:hypothetical protein